MTLPSYFFSGGVRAKDLCPASPGKIYGQLTLGRHSVTADAYFFFEVFRA